MNRGRWTIASLLTVIAGLLAANVTIQAMQPTRAGGVAAAEPGPSHVDDGTLAGIDDFLRVLADWGPSQTPPAPITHTSRDASSPVATDTETVVASVTFPAGHVVEGTVVRFRAGGSCVGVGIDQLIIRCRLGPDADCTFSVAPDGSENWVVHAEMIVHSPGPPIADVWVNGLAGHSVAGFAGDLGCVDSGARLSADLDGDVTASIRLFFSPWQAGDTATLTNCSIELVPRAEALSTP